MSSFLCSLVMNAKAILSFPDLAPLSTVQHISVRVSLEDTDGFECLFTFYYLTMEPALLPVPSCIQKQFIRGKEKTKKLIFLEKCIQHLIEAWRKEAKQRILTNFFWNIFFFHGESRDKKCLCPTNIHLPGNLLFWHEALWTCQGLQ